MDAYEQGYTAFQNDLDMEANPYGDLQNEQGEWADGWRDAEEHNAQFGMGS